MKFKIILSDKGKEVYKGGNIEILSKMLFTFEAKNKNKAEAHFYNVLCETLGSASENLYKVIEVKNKRVLPSISYLYCDCGNTLKSDNELRLKICKDCI